MPQSSSTQSVVGRDRRRGGRPSVPDDAALSCRVSSACTAEQRERLRLAAASVGLTVSQYMAHVVADSIGRVERLRPAIPAEFREAWIGLAPLSSNLHQLVRHLNWKAAAGEPHDEDALARLLDLVPRLAEQLSELRKALLPTR